MESSGRSAAGRAEKRCSSTAFPGSLIQAGEVEVYLSPGAGLAAGSDQVGGVGQVDEQLLLRLQNRSR